MDGLLHLFEKFFDLYVDVFKKDTLAAAITTLLFVVVFLVWKDAIKRGKLPEPDNFWEKPEFGTCVGWLILTPFLDLLLKGLGLGWDAVSWVVKLYAETFKDSPLAGTIAFGVLLAVYGIYRLVIRPLIVRWCRKRLKPAPGLLRLVGAILVVCWLPLTPVVKIIIEKKPPEAPSPKSGSPNGGGQPKGSEKEAAQPK